MQSSIRKIHVVINPAAGQDTPLLGIMNRVFQEFDLVPNSSVTDGLLDVIVVQQASLRALLDVLGSISGLKQVQVKDYVEDVNKLNVQIQQNLQYWQGKEVSLVAEPAQTVQFDGEMLGKVAIQCRVVADAVRILTPAAPSTGAELNRVPKDESTL